MQGAKRSVQIGLMAFTGLASSVWAGGKAGTTAVPFLSMGFLILKPGVVGWVWVLRNDFAHGSLFSKGQLDQEEWP